MNLWGLYKNVSTLVEDWIVRLQMEPAVAPVWDGVLQTVFMVQMGNVPCLHEPTQAREGYKYTLWTDFHAAGSEGKQTLPTKQDSDANIKRAVQQ